MAVLSNTAIIHALKTGLVDIRPRPAIPPGHQDTPYDTVSVDLRLSPRIYLPKEEAKGLSFKLTADMGLSDTLNLVYDEFTIPDTGFNLEPSKFILGNTVEKVSLPLVDKEGRKQNCLAARIEGRSSAARLGLIIHFTAPTIHAGFAGRITLEIINLGPRDITLYPETYICQLILETVDGIPTEKESQFQGQEIPLG